MLTFIKLHSRVNYRNVGLYQCSCGLLTVTRMDSVRDGYTTSCGCVRAEKASKLYLRRKK